MEIFIVRHTSVKLVKGYCYGQSDVDLADSYLQEFEEIKKKLTFKNTPTVFTSPLKRCLLLTKYLFHQNYLINNALKELNFGEWELKSYSELEKLEEFEKWTKNYVNNVIPGGESYIELYNRVNDFFNDLLNRQDKSIVIITHAGVIRCILASILQISLKSSFQLSIDYGGLTKITKDNELITINYINSV